MNLLDAAVLNMTQRCCRAFQRLTGRTNVWLAAQLTNLSIIVFFVWAALYWWTSDLVTGTVVGVFCGVLLFVLTQTIFKEPIETYEKAAYLRLAKGFANPRRVRDALLRVSFLTLALVLWYPVLLVYVYLHQPIVILSYCLIVLTTVVLYLLASDPLPPCAGILPQWLRALVPSRLRATESSLRDSRHNLSDAA